MAYYGEGMYTFALVFFAVCAISNAVGIWACASGRVKMNSFLGIRTRLTRVNQETWRAGNAAAGRVVCIGSLAAAVVALWALSVRDVPGLSPVPEYAAVGILLATLWSGAKLANRAATHVLLRAEAGTTTLS